MNEWMNEYNDNQSIYVCHYRSANDCRVCRGKKIFGLSKKIKYNKDTM